MAAAYAEFRLSANQTARLGAGNHVEWDVVHASSGHVELSTGTEQQLGIATVPPGVWTVEPYITVSGTGGDGRLVMAVYNLTDGIEESMRYIAGVINPAGGGASHGRTTKARIVNNTETPKDIVIRIVSVQAAIASISGPQSCVHFERLD